MSIKKLRSRVSIVVLHEGKILGFHAEDPHSLKKYFFLPGGMIEPGETYQAAAVRETLEETGYKVAVVDGLEVRRRYDFEWNGAVHDCDTIFVAGKLLSTDGREVSDADYHRGVGWVSVNEISKVFNYHEEILEAVEKLIDKNNFLIVT